MVSILCLMGAVSGCSVGPDYHAPEVKVGSGFVANKPGGVVEEKPVVEWWEGFGDAELTGLVRRAVANNLDVKGATARVQAARAQRAIEIGGFYPKIDANGSYTHVRASENGVASAFGGGSGAVNPGSGSAPPPGSGGSAAIPGSSLGEFELYQGSFDASWEVDVFGRTRRSVEASSADLAAALEDRRDVLVSLLGEVARTYVELRILQRRLELSQENVETQRKSARITEDRQKQGLVNRLDPERANAQVATTLAGIPELEASIATTLNKLAVLVGEQPGALKGELEAHRPAPPQPSRVLVGLPADLIRRRPDVRKAERQLAAANARIGVATADLYPRLMINGSLGLQSLEPGSLLDYKSRFYSIGPQVTIPIFEGGRLRAAVKLYEAREREAGFAFQKAVLDALRDAEDGIVNYEMSQRRLGNLRDAVGASERAYKVALELYQQGLGDFLNVLDAERALFSAQDALAQGEGAVDTSLVALYKALGGGWEVSPDDLPKREVAESGIRVDVEKR